MWLVHHQLHCIPDNLALRQRGVGGVEEGRRRSAAGHNADGTDEEVAVVRRVVSPEKVSRATAAEAAPPAAPTLGRGRRRMGKQGEDGVLQRPGTASERPPEGLGDSAPPSPRHSLRRRQKAWLGGMLKGLRIRRSRPFF